jgi:hypothetical protein
MTPGPWIIDDTTHSTYILALPQPDGARPIVAVLGRSNPNAAEDAQAIATVPAILEAVRTAHNALAELVANGCTTFGVHWAVEQLKPIVHRLPKPQ